MRLSSCVKCGCSLFKNIFLKIRHGKNYKFPVVMSCPLSSRVEIDKGGSLHIGSHMSAQRNLVLIVRKGAEVTIGNNVQFNYDCIFVSRGVVKIGDDVMFGPGCKIYDHDHDYKKTGKARRENFVTGTIEIGNGCWFGADCVILKGTKIGDNCVFGAGSVISGTYEDNTLVIQKKHEITKSIERVIKGEE